MNGKKIINGSNPAMQMHLMREQALADLAKKNPAYARFREGRSKARKIIIENLPKAGLYFQVLGGYDEDSIVSITATELEVAADLKTVIGPEKQVVSAGYANGFPLLSIEGLDIIAAYMDGFRLECSPNMKDPLTIRPRIKGSRAYIIGMD